MKKYKFALIVISFVIVLVLCFHFRKWVTLSEMNLSGKLVIEVPNTHYNNDLSGFLIRDFDSDTEKLIVQNERGTSDPVFNEDRSKILFSKGNEICEYDLSSNKFNVIKKEKKSVMAPKYVPNSNYISYFSYENKYTLTLYNTETKEIKSLEKFTGNNTCSWEPTGKYAIFANKDKTNIIKYNLTEDENTEIISGYRAVFSKDGRYIAYTKSAKETNILTVKDTVSGEEYTNKTGYKQSFCFGPTSDKIIFMTQDLYQKKLIVWDIKTNKQAVVYKTCPGISNDFDWR